ncbi:hypothetical protein TCE0_047f17995 [Talaromyces pinophilus]|uniref:AB hydrolase-1 domain-containing protein n=1 Tax=Talaromyces pinophilus TaxID=128442 RepID=A0A0B8N276_TALPI|nr:hypothetical protein TCE0_047f17995 [Talaromyces pinophilus]
MGHAHSHDIKLHRKYGDTVRIGPNAVSIGSATATKAIYGIGAGLRKSDLYPVQYNYSKGKLIPGIFTTTDEQLNKDMKRPVSSLYSLSNVLHHEGLVDQTIEFFISELKRKFADTNSACNIDDWLHFFAFDVMSEVTFARRIGFIERGTDVDGTIAGIWKRFRYFGIVGQMPWLDKLWDKSSLINALLPAKSSAIVTFTFTQIKKRIEDFKNTTEGPIEKNNGQPIDFFSQFLKAKFNHPEIPDWYLTSWTTSNMLAGSDSTAIYLRSIIYYLLKNPESYRKILDELSDHENRGKISKVITWAEAKSLNYLDACIKEAGRLHPVVGQQFERVAPIGGITVNGHFIPEGTVVGINPWVSHRDKTVFGEDAEAWNPDRWLVEKSEQHRMESSMLVYFSSKGFGILAVDLLGYGDTDKPLSVSEYKTKKIASEIIEILDLENITKVHGVAHDFGSLLLSRIANYYPDRLYTTTFLAVPYSLPGQKFDLAKVNALTKQVAGFESLETWLYEGRGGALAPFITEEERETHFSIFQGDYGPALNWYRNRIKNYDYDDEITAELDPTLSLPTLVIQGSEDKIAVPQLLDFVRSYIPHLRSRPVPTGHWVHLEAKDTVNQYLEEFFSDVKPVSSVHGSDL